MSIVKLINTNSNEEVQFPKLSFAINHLDSILSGINRVVHWRLSCIGYSDEHWQGYETFRNADGSIGFVNPDEPQWIILDN